MLGSDCSTIFGISIFRSIFAVDLEFVEVIIGERLGCEIQPFI